MSKHPIVKLDHLPKRKTLKLKPRQFVATIPKRRGIDLANKPLSWPILRFSTTRASWLALPPTLKASWVVHQTWDMDTYVFSNGLMHPNKSQRCLTPVIYPINTRVKGYHPKGTTIFPIILGFTCIIIYHNLPFSSSSQGKNVTTKKTWTPSNDRPFSACIFRKKAPILILTSCKYQPMILFRPFSCNLEDLHTLRITPHCSGNSLVWISEIECSRLLKNLLLSGGPHP